MKKLIQEILKNHKIVWYRIKHYLHNLTQADGRYILILSNEDSKKANIDMNEDYNEANLRDIVDILGCVRLEFTLFELKEIQEMDDFLEKETNKN